MQIGYRLLIVLGFMTLMLSFKCAEVMCSLGKRIDISRGVYVEEIELPEATPRDMEDFNSYLEETSSAPTVCQ